MVKSTSATTPSKKGAATMQFGSPDKAKQEVMSPSAQRLQNRNEIKEALELTGSRTPLSPREKRYIRKQQKEQEDDVRGDTPPKELFGASIKVAQKNPVMELEGGIRVDASTPPKKLFGASTENVMALDDDVRVDTRTPPKEVFGASTEIEDPVIPEFDPAEKAGFHFDEFIKNPDTKKYTCFGKVKACGMSILMENVGEGLADEADEFADNIKLMDPYEFGFVTRESFVAWYTDLYLYSSDDEESIDEDNAMTCDDTVKLADKNEDVADGLAARLGNMAIESKTKKETIGVENGSGSMIDGNASKPSIQSIRVGNVPVPVPSSTLAAYPPMSEKPLTPFKSTRKMDLYDEGKM